MCLLWCDNTCMQYDYVLYAQGYPPYTTLSCDRGYWTVHVISYEAPWGDVSSSIGTKDNWACSQWFSLFLC